MRATPRLNHAFTLLRSRLNTLSQHSSASWNAPLLSAHCASFSHSVCTSCRSLASQPSGRHASSPSSSSSSSLDASWYRSFAGSHCSFRYSAFARSRRYIAHCSRSEAVILLRGTMISFHVISSTS